MKQDIKIKNEYELNILFDILNSIYHQDSKEKAII